MISRCLNEAQRIAKLSSHLWAAEVNQLPTACGNEDCSTGNCQKVCQDYLCMQFLMLRTKRRLDRDDMTKKRAGK